MFKDIRKRYHDTHDLENWKEWLVDMLSLIFVFILPVNLAFVFPIFINTGNFALLVLDMILWILLLLKVLIPSVRPHITPAVFLSLFSAMVAGFFIVLGPGYARSAWIITCTVLFVIFEGKIAGLLYLAVNAAFLVMLFFLFSPGTPVWEQARADGILNWFSYILNLTVLALLSALSANFVISRLDSSLKHERQAVLEFQAAMEELEASNEQFEVINRELLDSQRLLQESEIQYRELAELLPLTVFKCNTSGKVTYANPRAFSDFGYGRSDFDSGLTIDRVFSADHLEKALTAYNIMCIEKGHAEGEFIMQKKDGTPFPAIIYASPIIHDNAITGITGAVMDISSRIEMEEENRRVHEHLLQAQKMEAIGTLAGGIAHDFNNILTGIIGYTEIARDDSPDAAVKENLTHVLQFCSRATDLVRQILTLSRKHEHVKNPLSIVPVIKEAVKLLRASLPATIAIDINDRSVNDIIIADPTEILQVIMNLGTNSAHAMRERGGQISVNIANVDGPGLPDSGAQLLKIIFSDTGSGIPDEILGRIFDPFYTTKPTGEGTGLGLSITESIVRNSGGSIIVSSKPGYGTAFVITFPVYTGHENKTETADAPDHVNGSGRILVVDDESPIAHMEKVMLEKLGYTVDTCSSGSEGLSVIRQDPARYDLVITDQTMPSMTGAELAREITRLRPGMPILLCTGYSEKVTRDNFKSFGISSMIYKPLSISVLSLEVSRLLEGKQTGF